MTSTSRMLVSTLMASAVLTTVLAAQAQAQAQSPTPSAGSTTAPSSSTEAVTAPAPSPQAAPAAPATVCRKMVQGVCKTLPIQCVPEC